MWCTLHLQDENEKKTEEFVTSLLPEDICTRCFHITRRRLRKREGQWTEESEELLPGYVFIETSQPETVYRELKKASKYLLFSDERFVSVLTEDDRKFLEQITDKTGRIGLSVVRVKKIGDKKEIEYLSGPLAKVSDQISWIDLHRRFAKVDTGFLKDKKGFSLSFYFEGESIVPETGQQKVPRFAWECVPVSGEKTKGNDALCGM